MLHASPVARAAARLARHPHILIWTLVALLSPVLGLSTPSAARAGEPVPVVLPTSFDVSPSGDTVVLAWRGDLWTVPIQGGHARRLTSHPSDDHSPRFSPDGSEIAFVSDRYPGGQVFVMPAAGGAPEQLTYHTDGFGLEAWYPDGTALLVRASRDDDWRSAARFFRLERTRRCAPVQLFNAHGRDGSLGPNGRQLLFVREGERWWRKGYRGSRAAQIWLFTPEAEQAEARFRKLSPDDGVPREWPLFDPSGERLYYVSEEDGTRNLRSMDLTSGKHQPLTRFTDDGVTFPRLAANGRVIVFRRLFDLYALDLESDQPPRKIPITYHGDTLWPAVERRLESRASRVVFTPDGKQIALVAGDDVFVMDREMREPRRVTDTAEPETEVVFAPDGKALYFVSGAGGQPDIWRAVPADPDRYWWQNDEFKITRVTHDPEVERDLRFRPDGQRLAFVRKGGEIWTVDPDGAHPRRVLQGWSAPRYCWSPDGRWLAYSVSDDTFNSDVWLAPVDGSRPPYNVSRHPDNDSGPVWSPDGRKIAFTGRRTHRETDVYYVYLRQEDEQTSSRDRQLEKALAAMKKGQKKTPARKAKRPTAGARAKTEPGQPAPKKKSSKPKKEPADPKKGRSEPPAVAKSPADPADPGQKAQESPKDQKPKKPAEKSAPKVVIDFDGLHERIHRISIPESRESHLVWSPDSRKLGFRATVKSVSGLYTVEIPSDRRATPRKLSTTVLGNARWLKATKELVGSTRGQPAAMSATGSVKTFAFRVRQTVDLAARRTAAFDTAWYVMRESFYDGGFNNLDWDAVRRKYRGQARHCLGRTEFGLLVNLMLGELNASHMGFTARRGATHATAHRDGWFPSTVHLGVRWDPTFEGPGLRIRDVIPDGPASRKKCRLRAGEVVLSIDGLPVAPATDLTRVLNTGTDHDYRLEVQGAGGKTRTVTLRAATGRTIRRLLYEKTLKDRQQTVKRLSKGTLGYCHIAGMNWSSFERFEAELYAIGYGKQGLIIDVRDNGGGSTADHLLTVLCQPRHAITVPRRGGPGYPQDRSVYARWEKPIVVLCNQNSFSNAEIFSHAVKQLGRGPLVGVRTAGGVISTGGAAVLDEGFIRTPFRGWFLLNGEDMERNGAEPDHVLWPRPGELPTGVDRQLEKAVAVGLLEVKRHLEKPRPRLRYARERDSKRKL